MKSATIENEATSSEVTTTPAATIIPQADKQDAPIARVFERHERINILGNTIIVDELLKVINDAKSTAGRASKDAKTLGLGSVAKDISGRGIILPGMSVLSLLAKHGKVGDTPERQKAAIAQIKGLNLLIDGLALLGLAKRMAD